MLIPRGRWLCYLLMLGSALAIGSLCFDRPLSDFEPALALDPTSAHFVERAGAPLSGPDFYAVESVDSAPQDRDLVERVRAYCESRQSGAGFDRKDFELLLNQITSQTWAWGPGKGAARLEIWEGLQGLLDATPYEHQVRAEFVLGLVETGQLERARSVAEKSLSQLDAIAKELYSRPALETLETRRRWEQALGRMGIAFSLSADLADRRRGLELANRQLILAQQTNRDLPPDFFRNAAPHIQAQRENILLDNAVVNLTFCLQTSGLAQDPALNPFLASEPETELRFRLRTGTGLPRSSRIAVGDYDGDGYADLFFPAAGLWKNMAGSGKFEQVDQALGLSIRGQAGSLLDINGDGLLDAVTVSANQVQVALQDREGKFRILEQAADRAAANPEGMGWFDGDADGLPDLYLASYEGGRGAGTQDIVLRNRGDGSFTEVSKLWGFDLEAKWCGRGVSPADFNRDGRPDLYVSNYRLQPNLLWVGTAASTVPKYVSSAQSPYDRAKVGAAGTTESSAGAQGDQGLAGYSVLLPGSGGKSSSTWGHTIGSVWGDIDNNGWQDLISANLAHPRFIISGWSDITRVYLNDGKQFRDNTTEAGIPFRETHSDPLLADFDNDGDLDLMITNIYPFFTSQFFLNDGRGRFQEATWKSGAVACNGWGQAAADFDNDGDLDWLVCDGNSGVQLFENQLRNSDSAPREAANYLRIKLQRPRDSDAQDDHPIRVSEIGTRVELVYGEQTQSRELYGGRGTSSFDEPVIHVGLGAYQGPVKIKVFWLNGECVEYETTQLNRIWIPGRE